MFRELKYSFPSDFHFLYVTWENDLILKRSCRNKKFRFSLLSRFLNPVSEFSGKRTNRCWKWDRICYICDDFEIQEEKTLTLQINTLHASPVLVIIDFIWCLDVKYLSEEFYRGFFCQICLSNPTAIKTLSSLPISIVSIGEWKLIIHFG